MKTTSIALLSLLAFSMAAESAWAAKQKLAPGACVTTHRHVVANGASCRGNCTGLNWCANVVCTNGSLATLPLPCHSPEACPARTC